MENNKNQESKPQRDEKGRFLPGNTIGKIPREKLYIVEELDQAIREVEEEGDEKTGEKLNLLKHYVRLAFKDRKILRDLVGKKIPKKTFTELQNTGAPFNLFVTEFSGLELPPDLQPEIRKKIEEYRKEETLKKQGEEN